MNIPFFSSFRFFPLFFPLLSSFPSSLVSFHNKFIVERHNTEKVILRSKCPPLARLFHCSSCVITPRMRIAFFEARHGSLRVQREKHACVHACEILQKCIETLDTSCPRSPVLSLPRNFSRSLTEALQPSLALAHPATQDLFRMMAIASKQARLRMPPARDRMKHQRNITRVPLDKHAQA